jgi:two-component system, OmpR family, KDP operon response regulator KdpE
MARLASTRHVSAETLRCESAAGTRKAREPDVLVVDDDPAIRKYLRRILTEQRYGVREVASAKAALQSIAERRPDLLILSLDSFGLDGSEAILSVRALASIPIVAISVHDNEDSIVEALESGADDYVKKPFGTREFLARIQSALRRTMREQGKPPLFVSGDLKVDLARRLVWSQGRHVHLSTKPYEVLRVLVENGGKVVSHEDILISVWGAARKDRLQYLRLAIRELRRSLESDPTRPSLIVTETRVGYRLRVQPPMDRGRIDRARPPAEEGV